MTEDQKKLAEALDVFAEYLNAGPSDLSNGNVIAGLHLVLARLTDDRAHMVANWWCCLLAQICGEDQAQLIARQWLDDGKLKEGWDKE